MPSLRILLCRNNDKCNDDKINIVKVNDIHYKATFTVSETDCENNTPPNYTQLFTRQQLKKFLHSLLSTLPYDTDGYKEIQLDLPNGLQQLFNVKELHQSLQNIITLVNICIDCWPSVENTVSETFQGNHLFFDDDCQVIARY